MCRALRGSEPGTTIELQVQRAGHVMRVPVRLSQRPTALRTRESTDIFMSEREQAATEYWESNFAKLLDQQTL